VEAAGDGAADEAAAEAVAVAAAEDVAEVAAVGDDDEDAVEVHPVAAPANAATATKPAAP